MNRKILLMGAAISASLALGACDSSSSKKKAEDAAKTDLQVFIENYDQERGEAACKNIGTRLSADPLDVGGVDKNQCILPSRIGVNTTLTEDVIWVADSKVKVGFGDAEIEAGDVQVLKDNAVTLTIEPGTEIRSTSGSAVIITRGSKIDAQGTAADPIIMSSLEQSADGSIPEDYDGAGEWGGFVMMGFGKHNKCPDNSEAEICNLLGEGGVGFFGGNDNTDNSGIIRYLVITEGGAEIAPDNELNGFTLQGVGAGTDIEYVQINDNSDDGIEWFGGAADVKYLVLTGNQDDSIDWDEGFSGNIQYAIIVQGASHDKGLETDNNGSSMDALPRSMPTIANLTIVADASGGTGIVHREGTGAFMFNSVVTGYDFCLDIDDAATHALIDTDLIYQNVIFDCVASAKDDVENVGVDFAVTLIESSVSSVLEIDPVLDVDFAATAAGAKNLTVDYGLSSTADTDFLEVTDYAGALEDGATPWWNGWTVGSYL